ncbi:MAG: zinc metalloprotease HtpX [Candidatus Omnitrophica bacterium]|nr:zinc metalloprotease HtpX [Candidatus Omnitrophota bacterium]MDD5573886.1 zinc metalloprotease HtpX [Candidatus Omnitrophota bacterium]
MPFSFIDIEEKKTRLLGLLFFFVILFYFLTAYLLLVIVRHSFFQRDGFAWPSGTATAAVLGVAFFVALLHWATSTSHLIEKLSLSIGAIELDERDVYHKGLQNIIDEVSVAIGGRRIQGMVIPSVSLNAFALEDFQGQAVIGVTEGLLTRLNRAQLEAVVGHEAGHIAGGDCLSTTVTCALAELYDEMFSRLKIGMQRSRGRGGVLVLVLFLIVFFMRFLSMLLRYFISRQKEYRADAVSVRLTRNPLSLAEALSLISTNWRGSGAAGERLESIFIINPNLSRLDEHQGLFSDVFSTHPPIGDRIRILTEMAHLDKKTLEDNLKKFRWVSPVAQAEFKEAQKEGPRSWSVFMDQEWRGPFGLEELSKIAGMAPEMWVRPEGAEKVIHAYEDKVLMPLFSPEAKNKASGKDLACPHCRTSLEELFYEGVPVLKCSHCEGVFAPGRKVSRLLIRRDKTFDEETIRLGQMTIRERDKRIDGLYRQKAANAWFLDCPQCGRKMRRQFFVYSYPVEIDRCVFCEGIWFDRQELEVLQYIYENKEQFFDDSSF